ncbi:hypothetical protein FHS48_001894 [Novispirillum itersonii]|uniref:Uncharacterized protein n=1 Tax=Novispirillum itersonii TaxID=189 RepID=A0A7W9ZG62_NOVIT|nr:hypothetical protein [Novispirillum itersonii]
MVTERALFRLRHGQGLALEAAFTAVAPLLAGHWGLSVIA